MNENDKILFIIILIKTERNFKNCYYYQLIIKYKKDQNLFIKKPFIINIYKLVDKMFFTHNTCST